MKNILIPIDFSKHSKYACSLASKIAKKTNASVHLLHMVELPTGIIDMGSGNNFSIPESMLYIRKVKDNLLELKKKYFIEIPEVKHAIRFQNPFQGIKDYCEKFNIDLIVMGSRGHTALEEIIIGSNTEKTVRSMNIPVLVTKKENTDFKFKRIVFASSFDSDENEAFSKFVAFASYFKSKVYLLKINTPQVFESTAISKKKIEAFTEKYTLDNYSICVYSDTSVEQGILNFSEEKKVDLISLATHGRSGLSRFFNESISLSLSKNELKPVLTYKI